MCVKKVVMITGAAQGLGFDMSKGFAKNGYEVIAVDVKPAEYGEDTIHFVKADLKSKEEIKAVFDFAKKEFDGVDALINNGAISKFHKSIKEITVEEFDEVIGVNLRGSFICCQEFIKANKGRAYGRIVNIASTRFHQNEADWEAYGASKGGLISLTNTLCVSLSNTNITVNAISPGWIEVNAYDMLAEIDHKQHPSGRVGKPADITRAALFFADEQSSFISGANLIVDGGMTKKMIYANSNDFWENT